jgi:hypothetical protein
VIVHQEAGDFLLPLTLPKWRRVKQALIATCQAWLDGELDRACRAGRVQSQAEAAIEARQFQTLARLERCTDERFWLEHQRCQPEFLLNLREVPA